jgi:glutathione S-transferase
MGVDAKDRAVVEMWNRRMGLVLFVQIGRSFQHASEIFKTRIRQMPEVAEVARAAALAQMRMIDGLIAGRRFITGERYITAMVALGLGEFVGLTVNPGLANLTRWYGEVSARPSARA